METYNTISEYLESNMGKAILAMYQLTFMAKTWNKEDNFTPDFNNAHQYKFTPRFKKSKNGKYVAVSAINSFSYHTTALVHFKTKERAEQFGKQFINLWNDFLLW